MHLPLEAQPIARKGSKIKSNANFFIKTSDLIMENKTCTRYAQSSKSEVSEREYKWAAKNLKKVLFRMKQLAEKPVFLMSA